MLAPNAMRVMDELLEVGDRLRAAGDMFKAINIYTKGSGSAKLDHVGGFTVEDEGILGLTIARPVLHQELLKKCEEMSDRITIRYSSELESIKEDSDGCEAVLKGGSTVQGESTWIWTPHVKINLITQDRSSLVPTEYDRKSGNTYSAKTTSHLYTVDTRASVVSCLESMRDCLRGWLCPHSSILLRVPFSYSPWTEQAKRSNG